VGEREDKSCGNEKGWIRAKQILSQAMVDRYSRPIVKNIESLLSKNGIDRQVYHANSVQGGHCQAFLQRPELWNEIGLLMKDVSKQRKKPTVDSAGIDTYISTMRELSETLNMILQMATSNTNKSDKECDQFKDLCILLGQQWRKSELKQRPPKLHLVEAHLWQDMQKFRNLSYFDEGGIECLHHWWKVKARLFNPIRLWASQVKAILKRKTVETSLGGIGKYSNNVGCDWTSNGASCTKEAKTGKGEKDGGISRGSDY